MTGDLHAGGGSVRTVKSGAPSLSLGVFARDRRSPLTAGASSGAIVLVSIGSKRLQSASPTHFRRLDVASLGKMTSQARPPSELMLISDKLPLGRYLQRMWQRRHFAFALPAGQLRAQNMNTALGNLWHVMNPVLLIAVYFVIFGIVLDVSRGVENFLGFLGVGVFTFHYSQKTLVASAKSISSNQGLLRSFQFPRALLPLATLIGQSLSFVPAVAVMLLLAITTGEMPRLGWLLLLPVFGLQILFNLGASLFLSRMGDQFPDVQNALPFLFRLIFYLSGVLYLADALISDSWLLALLQVNPFYAFVTLARAPVLGELGPAPPTLWLTAALWSAVLLCAGFWYFRAGERQYGRG